MRQDELLAELEKLEKNLDENVFEADGAEDGDLCPKVLTSASPSHPGKNSQFLMIVTGGRVLYEFIRVAQDIQTGYLSVNSCCLQAFAEKS